MLQTKRQLRQLEGEDYQLSILPTDVVCAESREDCKNYMKIICRNGGTDPVVDDLATLAWV